MRRIQQGPYDRQTDPPVRESDSRTQTIRNPKISERGRNATRFREHDTETCMFCLGNERCARLRMSTIISCGESVWFAAQTDRDTLSSFHALICPEQHISHIGDMPESVWHEMRDVKKCFRQMVIGSAIEVEKIHKEWSGTCEDSPNEEEDRLTQSILAEHQSRMAMTPRSLTFPADKLSSNSSVSLEQQTLFVPIFFEFHLPRNTDKGSIPQWKQLLRQGGHYTVDCLILTSLEADKLKSALKTEFANLSHGSEINDDFRSSEHQRRFKKLESRTFFRHELPHPDTPPPYLYIDFGLMEACLLILAPGDMTKKSVIDLIKNCMVSRRPHDFEYTPYLAQFKKLYEDYDCFRPID